MISNPRIGQSVLVRYAQKARYVRPLHGKTGVVVVANRPIRCDIPHIPHVPGFETKRKAGPRNHGVLIDGVVYVIPCGNLNPVPAME